MSFSSIAEIFINSVEEHSQRPALILPDRSWTYMELGSIVNSAAIKLKKYFHTEESRLAIIGDNHLAYIVAYFAAQFLGVSTVEVSRNESLDTILDIVESTGVCFVVTDREDLENELKTRLPVESFQTFLLSCEAGNINELSTISSSIDKHREASIVYTSGTTGHAKGVVLSQENFCFIAHVVADYLNLSQKDRYALILPLCHTYGKSILLSSFVAGAAVVMMNNFKNMPKFLEQLANDKCTVLSVVPYHIHVLLKGINLLKYDISSLRAITSSANKLSPDAIDNLLKILPGIQIFSMYGLTESTTRACYVPPEILQVKKGSCGKALPGVNIKIIDGDGNDLPNNKTGEILLYGPNIMKGYFGDPDLTKESLVNGWLRTGDIGYMDNDGFLYIEDRKKDIIKCAGERIGPGEIEEVLMEYAGVLEAAIIGEPDMLMGEIIHAYIVPRSESLNKTELRNHCLKRLSHNKVPYHYTIIDSLPKTETGKIQKYLLTSN